MSNQQENALKSCKAGQIWQLGDHRLYCGSSDNLPKQLFGDLKVRMICTDPPYGVAYVENKEHFKNTIGANISCANLIANDQLQSDE